MNYIRSLWEDFKAFRRGEQRVTPRGVRGRIYSRVIGDSSSPGSVNVKAGPTASLTMTVRRADGRVETITVPAKVSKHG